MECIGSTGFIGLTSLIKVRGLLAFGILCLAGNEGMEKNMETTIMGYIRTAVRIHSCQFIGCVYFWRGGLGFKALGFGCNMLALRKDEIWTLVTSTSF